MANPQVEAYGAAQKAQFAEMRASIVDLSGDLDNLNKQIKDLNDRPPGWTPEDQTILDSIQADGLDLAAALKAAADRTGPAAPPAEPTPPPTP